MSACGAVAQTKALLPCQQQSYAKQALAGFPQGDTHATGACSSCGLGLKLYKLHTWSALRCASAYCCSVLLVNSVNTLLGAMVTVPLRNQAHELP